MKRKAFVLLSGGLDSSTALALAANTAGPAIEGVSVYYGQRHSKEILYAKRQCDYWGAAHAQINAGGLLEGGMLTDPGVPIPNASYEDLPAGVSPTYVPFRNGTMLSLIAARAQAWVNANKVEPSLGVVHPSPDALIYFGAHAEDAHNWAYPDCTPEFVGAMANAIYVGTYHAVRLVVPFQHMKKWQIVRLGVEMCVPFTETWSCYAGGEHHCGTCPTCRARKQAFEQADVPDPTSYAA